MRAGRADHPAVSTQPIGTPIPGGYYWTCDTCGRPLLYDSSGSRVARPRLVHAPRWWRVSEVSRAG